MQTADIQAIAAENYLDADAFAAFLEYEDCDLDEAPDLFNDQYAGTFDSLAAWAENLADETGMLESVPESLRNYFDFEAWARDAELNGDVWTADVPSGIAVFWNR